MKVSVYSTGWSVTSKAFDYKGALDNWFTFADEVCVAVPTNDTDDSVGAFQAYAAERGYNVHIVRTDFDLSGTDPFAYGKTLNAALQACTGDLLWQQDLDERTRVSLGRLQEIHRLFESRHDISAVWVPTIDLYGSADQYLRVGQKWYVHRRGLYRGACRAGIKADGHPDYNKTSTDELVDLMGNLVPTVSIYPDLSLESLRSGVTAGWPLVYHLGYLSLNDRLARSVWWKQYWEKATNGDPNQHPTTIEELAAKETKPHHLPLWPSP